MVNTTSSKILVAWKHTHKNGYSHEVRNDISDKFNNALLLTYIAHQLLGSKRKY